MINNRAKRELRETQKRLKVKMKPMRTLCLKIHFVVYVPMCLKKHHKPNLFFTQNEITKHNYTFFRHKHGAQIGKFANLY
jgi:hypothetical protein